jgi:xanthine dehydrogenase small subunit
MERTVHFLLNEEASQATLPSGLAVLDLLRRERHLTGTREGCREGDCGACLVLLGEPRGGQLRYRAVNSCLLPLGELEGRHLVTIEGLNPPAGQGPAPALNPIQQSFVSEGATQCGFCTPGFIVALTGYFLGNPDPDPESALEAVAGNLCRCTGYASIRRAIGRLLEQHRALPAGSALERCVGWGIVQPWMREAPARLAALAGGSGVPRPGAARAAAAAQASAGGPAAGAAGEPGPVLVAGGTDLFVQRPEALQDAPLVFLSERDLARTWVRDGRRYLGAMMPMEDLCGVPPFAGFLPCVASGPVRQRATVGGNLVNASPIGDFTIMLLALGAVLGIRGPGGRQLAAGATPQASGRPAADGQPPLRELPLRDFYRGYKKLDLAEGEVVEWVAFVEPGDGGFHFEKVGRRQHLDIASVNTAVCLRLEGQRIGEARLAAGGVASVPLLLARASASLGGRDAGRGGLVPAVADALALAQEEIAPISDVRGGQLYKRRLLKHLLLASFLRLLPEAFRPEDALALLGVTVGGGAAGGGTPDGGAGGGGA